MTAAPFAHPDVNYETMASELLLCFDSNEGRPLKVSVSPDDGPNNHGEIWNEYLTFQTLKGESGTLVFSAPKEPGVFEF